MFTCTLWTLFQRPRRWRHERPPRSDFALSPRRPRTLRVPVCVHHPGNGQRATSRSRNSQPFQKRSTNNEDMYDLRNFPYYRSPRFCNGCMLYMAVRINRESTPPTPENAGENYFRFSAAILEMVRGPRAGHRTINPVEIDQKTTKI